MGSGGRRAPSESAGGAAPGGWAELLGDVYGLRTLALGEVSQPTLAALDAAGALVHRSLDTGPLPAPAGAQAHGRDGWDLVICTSGGLRDPSSAAATAAVGPGGRLAMVVSNPRSPLRAVDAAGTQPRMGIQGGSLAAGRSYLFERGFADVRVFGLLRSSAAPVCAFDLAAPEATRAVLEALAVHIGGGRALSLRLLRAMSGRVGISALLPGWLILAAREKLPPEPTRITGKIGNRDSDELKVVRGEPPSVLDKRYAIPAKADAEAEALRTLSHLDPPIAPRLLRRPSPATIWMDWLPGRPLVVDRLGVGELVTWIEQAARVLVRIQRATARPGTGEVLVHGDYWLGNMLTARDGIVGVIDWTDSRWGSPRTDQDFLVDSLSRRGIPAPVLAELRTRCLRIFSSG